jgi:hypothetical protein
MNHLRARLRANHARLAFPYTSGVLRELLPDLRAAAPDWLAIAEAVEASEPGGSRPSGFVWNREATLRPDEGDEPNGLGRNQHGLVLLQTAELLRLLPRLSRPGRQHCGHAAGRTCKRPPSTSISWTHTAMARQATSSNCSAAVSPTSRPARPASPTGTSAPTTAAPQTSTPPLSTTRSTVS